MMSLFVIFLEMKRSVSNLWLNRAEARFRQNLQSIYKSKNTVNKRELSISSVRNEIQINSKRQPNVPVTKTENVQQYTLSSRIYLKKFVIRLYLT